MQAPLGLRAFVLPSMGENPCAMKGYFSLLKKKKPQGCFILNQWQGIDLQSNKHQEDGRGCIQWRKE